MKFNTKYFIKFILARSSPLAVFLSTHILLFAALSSEPYLVNISIVHVKYCESASFYISLFLSSFS